MHAKNHYQWNCGQAYIETNIQSSFRSKSLQRPSSKSYVPGAGTYTPNIHAVKAAPSHSGCFNPFSNGLSDDEESVS